MANLVNQYQVGKVTKTQIPHQLAEEIETILGNQLNYNLWKNNCKKAAIELNWETEKQVISTLI